MKCRVGDVSVFYVEHGEGRPVLILHGSGVDHRETEACFDPIFSRRGRYRRIYPDLPGMGQTRATASLRSAEDVLDTLVGFAETVLGPEPLLVAAHSAGAHFARGLHARLSGQIAGLALVCPLLSAEVGEVPDHSPVIRNDSLGDEGFRSYFVVQNPEMLDRYQRYVEPGIEQVDRDALERIGSRWEIAFTGLPTAIPTLIVAGRQDSTVGYRAAAELAESTPLSTLAVLDRAGHALPHEQPHLLDALIAEWLSRVDDAGRS